MPGHNVLETIYAVGDREQLKDPGASGTIKVTKSPAYMGLRSSTTESRTLPVPTVVNAEITLAMEVDGGDITVTVGSAYNEAGDTTFVFSEVGQFAVFKSVKVTSSVYAWRLTSHYGIANASPTEAAALNGLTATVTELNARAAAASRVVTVADAATYAVLAADSGKIHIMPDFAASCTLTLPTAAAGLEYEFIGKAVAADAHSWIFSTGGANFFLGGLGFADTDDPADTIAAVYPNGSSNDFCTVAAPGGGTRIYIVCDGTNWIINGIVVGATAPTFSDS